MTAHTPGPWQWDGKFTVTIPRRDGDASFRAFPEDARLIAAAPDLLDALIKLTNESAGFLAMADADTHGHTNRAVLRERIRLAQDAIAKAEGAQ